MTLIDRATDVLQNIMKLKIKEIIKNLIKNINYIIKWSISFDPWIKVWNSAFWKRNY